MGERPRVTIGAMILNGDGDLLLLKSPKWHGRYIFPCGHVEFGERLEDAVRREVREETGLEIDNISFLTHLEFINSKEFHMPYTHFVGLQYTCNANSLDVKTNDESSSYVWVNPEDALRMDLESGTARSIEKYLEKLE